MISRMVKKYFSAFASLLAFVMVLVMALTALAQFQPEPGDEKRGAQSETREPEQGGLTVEPGGTLPPGTTMTPGGEISRGTISGEVVSIDERAGVIEIISDQGQPQTFKVAGDARRQLKKIKKGDHVDLNLVLRAVDIRSTDKGGAQAESSQVQPGQDKHHPGAEP